LLTKEIIQENYDDFTPLNISQIKGVKTSQTGGTTGNILLKRNDASSRSSAWGSYKRYEDVIAKVFPS
jgi:phenylacetate-coenzyme A ligase PaaK-like adenylate-forming protein